MAETSLASEEVSRVNKRVDSTQVNIVLRPFASSIPMANVAFAVGNLIYSGFLLGWIPKNEAATIATMLLAFVAPLQLFPSVMAFLSRDTAGGTAFGVFGLQWVVQAIGLLRSGGAQPNAATGVYLLGLAVCFAIVAPVIFAGKPLLGTLLGISVLRMLGMAGIEFGFGHALPLVTGVIGLLLTAVAFYSAMAFLIEDVRLEPSPLTLRRGHAREAMEGKTDDQISLLTREAGIRKQL